MTLEVLPELDMSIWTDGTAEAGTDIGGGGTMLIYHVGRRTTQLTMPPGNMTVAQERSSLTLEGAYTSSSRAPPANHLE